MQNAEIFAELLKYNIFDRLRVIYFNLIEFNEIKDISFIVFLVNFIYLEY